MLPSRLFRSRWSALLWAVGILWTAYDVASASRPSPEHRGQSAGLTQDATGERVDPADLAILANAGG